MRQAEHQNRTSRLGGYLLIPHELLHLAGFRLAGKQCEYQWGNPYVTPVEPMTRRERLIGGLFPFIVFATLLVISGVLSGLAYGRALRGGTFFWFIFWTGSALVTGIYAGTAIPDLRKAYLLIFDKSWYSWTPFDFLYWPIIDWSEVRKNVAARENDDKQG
jgi:hypothetical protein